MKSVLISVRPRWCEKMINRNKKLEIRKTKPKFDVPFKSFVYCSMGDITLWSSHALMKPYIYADDHSHNMGDIPLNGRVIGEFICDGIVGHCEMANADLAEQYGLLRREALLEYSGGKELFGWHFHDFIVYEDPIDLSEFIRPYECHNDADCCGCTKCQDAVITRPPQSWCYVERIRESGEVGRSGFLR